MSLIRVLLLCALVFSVESKCTTTYTTFCEKVSDVQRFGLKSWESLIISPDVCSKAKVGTLDEVLGENFFGNAKYIEELYILDKITNIEPNVFSGLTQLTYIKLFKNQIKVIPKDAFADLFKSVKVDLQHNSIENIAHGLFGNSSIKIINLSNNKLNNLQVGTVNLASLERLSIKNNGISFIAPGSFHENLEYLNLAQNSISHFEPGVLEPLQNLKELILSNNRFKGIAIGFGLENLEKLDLSHNEIVGVHEGAFHKFIELKDLKLNHNYITYLSYNIFATGNLVRSLHLHYNAIMQLEERFGGILEKLEEITVSGNPWACHCLNIISTYITEKNITQPDCDKSYFKAGKSAVCVITSENYCTGVEELTTETFDNFRKSLKVDLCSDL